MAGSVSPLWKFSLILFAVVAIIALVLGIVGIYSAFGEVLKLLRSAS